MTDQKAPGTLEDYYVWLVTEHGVKVDSRLHTRFDRLVASALEEFEASHFWSTLKARYFEMRDEYLADTGYQLWGTPAPPTLKTKSYESFLLKTFRKNVLENTDWPTPPQGHWLLPPSWYEEVRDLVRTLFVTRYLDGVLFVVRNIEKIASALHLDLRIQLEAKDEGYYAAHAYVRIPVEVASPDFDTERMSLWLELQITTQVQEVLRALTHEFYERRRERPIVPNNTWQWDFASDDFSANYLGHVLHYMEGKIMDVRTRATGNRS